MLQCNHQTNAVGVPLSFELSATSVLTPVTKECCFVVELHHLRIETLA